MAEININTLIFEILNKISKIRTAKVSMFPLDDTYGHPPFLRFGFSLADETELISILKKIISEFEGNLRWLIIRNPDSKNCILIPEIFEKISSEGQFYKKNFWVKQFGEDTYKRYIDFSLEDIPKLSEHIKKGFPKIFHQND
ncbi:hypothetical protein [Chryseobacterium balustinum]|uniref:Uncharacterized protein n=1 Tax=Chryseobacterium balustinum TaxID=246 RepID=A0AAX2IRF4_9FLAO|nr:hypothetical protein [Chryseobacterium balustinum]AZB28458.1 hypothetical protein EB354_03810 [Chryseobacterium balustinum]SKC13127.1 hypothetical protein SAMN05421800_14410 [Chryseobacterium balustinum]SQA92552.1 Uncharacterised protein [Chryseobacterium balustinum]